MSEQVLDVSEMEAPEPLREAIEALQSLPAGDWLHLYHRMAPCHLYAWMAEQGFASDTRQGEAGCEVFIWRETDEEAAAQAHSAAAALPAWNDPRNRN